MLLEILIINLIVRAVSRFKQRRSTVFMEWKDYEKKIEFLNNFYFQQNCRMQSIRNMP